MNQVKRSGLGRTRGMACLVLVVMLCIGMLALAGRSEVYGAAKRVVKVAFFPMDGFHEKAADGTYSGMDVEYLGVLCDYVNWDVVYVECGSWDEALQMLSDHEVDLVGSAQYSQQRAQIYSYANLASGYTFGAIAVQGDSDIAYEDFSAMQDITYGIVGTYVRKNEFYAYLADHDIHTPQVREYGSTADLQKALADGEIDALVHSLTEIREGQRIVGRFAPMPIYYISYPGNDDVMYELNQGIADIKMNRPELENELMTKYYDSRLDHTILLDSEEKRYLEDKKELKVGYLDGFYPFSYESDGEYQGLVRQIFEEISVSIGTRFSYVKAENVDEIKQMVADGAIDIFGYCGESPASMKASGMAVTSAYARVPHVMVMKKGGISGAIETLAIVGGGVEEKASLEYTDQDTRVLLCNTQRDCLEAVKSGEADAAMCDGYLAEYLLGSDFAYNNLEIHSVLSDVHTVYMAVKEDDESPLLGILNKEIIQISDKMVSDYMLQDNFYSKMSLVGFVSDHSFPILIFICALAAGVIAVLIVMLRSSRRIQRLMYKDTDLPIWNLNYLKYRASRKIASDKSGKYAVVYTDIRQFRRYNTLFGWNAGQRILELFIRYVNGELHKEDELCARSYGDHFVFFVKYEDLDTLEWRLLNLEDRISKAFYDETQVHMTVAMGVCCITEQESDIETALAYAIQAADAVQGDYNNAVRIYDEQLRRQLRENHEREKLLEAVSIDRDFVTYYQAKVDIRTGDIVGAEALVRFKDPSDNGKIKPPGFFVPYYEQTGRITEIDFFVLECVCKMLSRRLRDGKNVVPISCNFSRMHFVRGNFSEKFEAIVNKYQVPKELIEVEITETMVVEDLEEQKVKETVEILRKRGVRLSIDDFGSGYSSLGVFEQIPASVIKLDRSFLLNNENHGRQVKIMRNIVNLAQDLDAQVVCEGVETEAHKELMMEIGAYVAQGYHYCKPMPEKTFEARLEQQLA